MTISDFAVFVAVHRQKKSLGKNWRKRKHQVYIACLEMSCKITLAMTRPGSCPDTVVHVPSAPKLSSIFGTRSFGNVWSALNAQ